MKRPGEEGLFGKRSKNTSLPFSEKGFSRLLKNVPAYRQAGICPALRGINLILALLDEEGNLLEGGITDSGARKDGK